MDVNLSAQALAVIEARLASGEFRDASEVVNLALALLDRLPPELDAQDAAWLREAYEEGLASGDGGPFEPEALLRQLLDEGPASGKPIAVDPKNLKDHIINGAPLRPLD